MLSAVEIMDAAEERALRDIEKYGCHVIHVLAEGDLPPFSYSVGIEQASGAPELIVIGLKHELSHSIVNQYNRRVRAGERFEIGQSYSGFIGGFDCRIGRVDKSHYHNYLGWCRWLYKGNDFQILQLIYPTTSGTWPWDVAAPESFRVWQPLLDKTANVTN